ncbi:MAG TPA: DinB family protein [Vicinamibacterales bacterium]|nr:DinB family protein [Vicinamibacterales bacterium]
MTDPHTDRVARLMSAFDEAMGRLITRVERAGDNGLAAPAAGGWSVAQIAWHVATVNDSFASIMAEGRGTEPAASGFVERTWRDIVAGMPPKLEAPRSARPPELVDAQAALVRLRESAGRVRAAIAGLTPERAGKCLHSGIVGTISVYQVAEWATAHAIRHNWQAKRALGEATTREAGRPSGAA